VQSQLERLQGLGTVVSELTLQELRDLETQLDAAGRRVREEVVRRAMEQVAARSKAEPTQVRRGSASFWARQGCFPRCTCFTCCAACSCSGS
jgi:DNA-binding GntR family transcriptional regulator